MNSFVLVDVLNFKFKKNGDMNMSIACMQMIDNNFIINNMFNRQYSIVFDGKNVNGNDDSCIIPVKSRREVELLLLSLGEEATLLMDEQARKLCNVWDWYGRTYSDIFTDLKWSYREEDEVLDIIEKIPLPKTLNNNFLKFYNDEPELERIDQEYVHKVNPANILVSKPYRCGNMFYFNGFTKSSEFVIDHSSDHLEGIVIFEAARQAGIASSHLAGISLSGTIVLLKADINYRRFIEINEPYLIRTIPVIRQKGGYFYVAFNIIQKGNSCATGYLAGLLYKDKESYKKHRTPVYINEVSKASNGN
jgi:hypothetical protein